MECSCGNQFIVKVLTVVCICSTVGVLSVNSLGKVRIPLDITLSLCYHIIWLIVINRAISQT